MSLAGKDVWEAIVRLGLLSGPYDPRANLHCANAEKIAVLLNDVLGKRRQDWLPKLVDTEDAMRAWEASTPREYVLRLYKFLNQLGYTVIRIDAGLWSEFYRLADSLGIIRVVLIAFPVGFYKPRTHKSYSMT